MLWDLSGTPLYELVTRGSTAFTAILQCVVGFTNVVPVGASTFSGVNQVFLESRQGLVGSPPSRISNW